MPATETISTSMRPKVGRPAITQRIARSGTVLALIVLIAVFGILQPSIFLGFANVRNILEQVAILTIIACAQTLVMVCGDFDLSLGATLSLVGAIAAVLMTSGVAIPIAILIALIAGMVAGMVNGFLVAVGKLSAFIATLATMTSIGGLAYVVTKGTTVHDLPEEFLWIGQARPLGIPMPVFIAVAFVLITWVLLRYTTLGRRWHAVGGSAEVARLSGVNVRSARFLAFSIAGLGAGIAGIVLVSRLASASASGGGNYMLISLAAVFLGMTVPVSGNATIGGTLIGVGILGVLENGLTIIGIDTYWQQVLTGVIIAAAVALSSFRARHL